MTYIPWLGSYGLLDPTDSFFLESGRELVEKNQFLLPLNNYVPWLDKPILFFWMVAFAYKSFGISPFIGRLPAALSAVGGAAVIYLGSRPFLSRRTALLAALIFLFTPLVSIVGHVCLTDMTLCALLAGAILFLFKGLEFSSKTALVSGYVFLALAVLCKGPISLIICGLAFLPYLIIISRSKKEFFEALLRLKPLLGAGIVLAVNLPWYVLASMATRGEFLVAFFFRQNFGRLVGTVNHQEPFYFYIPVFFGAFFPWCLVGLSAPGLIKKVFAFQAVKLNKYRRFVLLNLFWFISIIVLFSTIKTKLPTYILPCAPAFALLVSLQLEYLSRAGKLRRLVFAALLMTVTLAVGVAIHPLLKGYVREIIWKNIWIVAPLAISLAGAWAGLRAGKLQAFVGALLVFSFLICGFMVPRGMQIFFQERQSGFNKLACRVRDDGASVAMIYAEEPSVPWFTHKPVSRLQEREDAQKFLRQTPGPHYVLVQKNNLDRLEWFPPGQVTISESGKWHLVEIEPGSKTTPALPAEK